MARIWLAIVAALALGGAVASADVAEPDCTIEGSDRTQIIRGTPGPDVICALGGNDVIYAEGGDDVIRGGSGNDTIYGGANADRLEGGAGDDRLLGGLGKDRFLGGDGTDLADYSPQTGAVRVTLGNGVADDGLRGGREQDEVTADVEGVRGGGAADDLTGSPRDDLLSGGGGADLLRGGAGADRLVGGAGGDTFFGGTSPDTVDYSSASGPVTASIGDGPNDGTGGGTEGDDVRGDVEYLQGSSNGDVLTGDGLANILYGGGGDDELHGAGGRDQLLGGLGADDLDGGAGADLVTYADILTGGVKVTIGDAASGDGRTAGAEGDDVQATVERVIGTRFADDLTAASSGSTLSGYLGNDALRGGAGADVLDGHDGADEVSGGGGIDFINGGQGTDTLLARDGGFDLVSCGTQSDSHDSDGADTVNADCETRRAFAADDTGATDEDTPVTVDVLANDAGDAIGVTSATTAATSLVAGGVRFTPSGFDRLAAGDTDTASFEYTMNGLAGADTASVSVAIAGVNDAPSLVHGAAAGYTENAGATAIDSAITAGDVDDGDALESASVTIKSPRPGDALAMTNTASISGAFAAGVLTLTATGTPTDTEWTDALRSVAFTSSSDDPGASRAFDFTVGDGTVSTTSTRTMAIAERNDRPVVNGGPDGASTVGGGPQPVAGAVTLSDPDSGMLSYVVVTVAGGYRFGDVFGYDPAGNTAISVAPTTEDYVFQLVGQDTVANYEAALRRVTYDAGSIVGKRAFAIAATDDQGDTGYGDRELDVQARGPRVRNVETAPLAYTENDPPKALSGTLTLEDPDARGVQSATVEITGGLQPEDELDASAVSGLSAMANGIKSKVTLTGAGTLADYAAAMRAVAYRNRSDNPSTGDRTVSFTWTDTDGTTSPAATRTIQVARANDAPQAGDDSFDGAIGNTKLAVSTPSAAGPAKHITGTVLAGDTDVDGDTLTASSTDPDVNMAPDGTFTYVPPAGEETSDTFDYTVSDGHGGTDTGTVTVNIDQPAVWYVDWSAGGTGDGRSNAPLQSPGDLNPGGSADGLDDSGDLIFLYSAAGPGAHYGSGLVLESAQIVRAQPAGLSVGGADLVQAAGTLGPVSLTGPSAGRALELAPNADVRNLRIVVPATGTGVYGDAVGGATIAESSITDGAGAVAVDLLNGAGAIDIDASISGGLARITGRTGGSVSFSSADVVLSRINAASNANTHSTTFARATVDAGSAPAISVSGGSLSVGGGGGSFIHSNNTAVDIGSGTGSVTIAPPVSTQAGRLVAVTGHQGGAITLSGALSDTGTSRGIAVQGTSNTAVAFTGASKEIDTGTEPAILTSNNSGTTSVSFSGGGLDAHSTGSHALLATNGGKVEVTGTQNKLAADDGIALDVDTTTIGAAGLTFERIDAAGSAHGINLEKTGTAGGLHVTGTGTPGSGGTLLGSPSYNGLGVGVFLDTVKGVTLEDMVIEDAWVFGILGLGAQDVTVRDTTIRESTNSNVHLNGHAGVATLTGSTFDGAAGDNVRLNGSGSGTMDVVFDENVVDCTGPAPGNGIGLAIESSGTVAGVVSDSEVRCSAASDLFRADAFGTGDMTMNVVRNVFENRVPASAQESANRGVRLSSSSGSSLIFRVAENTIVGTRGNAVELSGTGSSSAGSSLQGTVVRNTIGRSGADRSGSADGNGIDLFDAGAEEFDALVRDNTIFQVRGNGIEFTTGSTTGRPVSPDVTIAHNVTDERPAFPLSPKSGLFMHAGLNSAGAFTACTDVVGNDFSAYGTTDTNEGSDFHVRVTGNAALRLPGYSVATHGNPAAYIGLRNPTTPATSGFMFGGLSSTGGAACEQPPVLPNVP